MITPTAHTALKSPGEIWKDIPGFEGSFLASNKGRIRSLDRIVPHKRCETQFVKGQMLKLNIKSIITLTSRSCSYPASHLDAGKCSL